ncbi:alpha/beta hydrolase [Streptomyces sp. NPDC047046]|uniref:alpha/beta hydrolase n=1 Tax=Streptomyces sp. NPDC047046 TaxID=3155378 RepID=UPI00340DE647
MPVQVVIMLGGLPVTRTPVVFIHGAWLHARSWESWAERFAGRGWPTHAPGWPGEPPTAGEARKNAELLPDLGLEELTEHYARLVRSLDASPVLVGHSVGGLVAQHLLGTGVGEAAVALAAAPVNEVPLPAVRSARDRAATGRGPVLLSPARFRETFANTVPEEEARRLYERYAIPAPRRLLDDLGCAGAPRHPFTAADTANPRRGPLLLVSGQEDLVVPDGVTRAVYKQYGDSTALTELKQFADRGHTLVVDGGRRVVADYVLWWLDEHVVGAT